MATIFQTRGLELHSPGNIWVEERIDRALDCMASLDLNTLVLHESDLMSRFVAQPEFTGSDDFTEYHRNRELLEIVPMWITQHYVIRLVRKAASRGIKVYLEVKELSFPPALVKKFGLRKDGRNICPNNPVWWKYLNDKYHRVSKLVPELGGVIVSPGSWESMISISETGCRCSECRASSPKTWYKRLIESIHQPLHAAGMRLAVRDFSYSPEEQRPIIEAISESPLDVIASLKVTPHDFYPAFPHNPAIADPILDGRDTWVEYDVFGQFCGWATVPAFMAEDIESRMSHALEHGVTGFYARTDWEMIPDAWCLGSVNESNLRVIAKLGSEGVEAGRAAALREKERLCSEVWGLQEVSIGARFLDQSLNILKKALYIRGNVFNQSSMLPLSYQMAWWHMDVHDNLWKWQPNAGLYRTDWPTFLAAALQEKDEALESAQTLYERRSAGNERFREIVEAFTWYVRMFAHAGKAIVLARECEITGSPYRRDQLKDEVERMLEASVQLQECSPERAYGELMFAHWRAERLAADLLRMGGEA